MPTYEYRCSAGHTFEQFQRMSEEPLRECPKCGAEAERLLSAGGGLLFKGSGFYITDYRNDAYRKAAAADAPKGSTGSEGGAKSSDSAADKTPAKPASDKPSSPGSSTSSSSGSG